MTKKNGNVKHKHVFIPVWAMSKGNMALACECGEKTTMRKILVETMIANSQLSAREAKLLKVVTQK